MKKTLFFFAAAFLIFLPINVRAQFEMPEASNIKASYSADDTSLNVKYQSYGLNVKLGVLSGHEFYLKGLFGEYQTSGIEYFPKYLYDSRISLSAISKTETIILSADSKSDKIYRTEKETDFGLNYFRTIEPWSTPQSTWMFALNYSSRRSFWEGIPIPYLAYRYLSEKFVFIAPFYAQWNMSRMWSVNASWFPVDGYAAGLKWQPSEAFSLELRNGLESELFLISGRADADESLYLQKFYVSLNPVWKIAGRAELSAKAGWIIRSRFYHGNSYSDVNDSVRTGDAIAGSAALKLFF